MLKLSDAVHARKKATDQHIAQFLFYHPYMGMLFCGIVMPILVLVAVSAICYAVMLPVSLFMGWL